MIVGITGAICSGKSIFTLYLTQTHGFEAINVMEIFKLRLIKKLREQRRAKRMKRLSSELIASPKKIDSARLNMVA